MQSVQILANAPTRGNSDVQGSLTVVCVQIQIQIQIQTQTQIQIQILADAPLHENPDVHGSLTAVCVQLECSFSPVATLFTSHLMTKQDNGTNLREKSSRDLHNYLPVTLTVPIGM